MVVVPDEEDVIEGEAVEVTHSRAVAVIPQQIQTSVIAGGTAGLAILTDEQFEENLAGLVKVRERVDKVKLAIMRQDVDYGTIPGTPKPTLLKPGAETLLRTFGLADSYIISRTIGDGENEPDITYEVRARIHVGDTAGPVIGEGVGEANSWEKKHRYRGAQARLCPSCGVAAIKRGKDFRTKDPNWYCDRKIDGCGSNFAEHTPAIEAQNVGQQENDDPYDLANTLLKMAKKRALVDGVLTATGTSGVFTQDEDAPGHRQQASAPAGAPARSQAAPSATPAPAAAPGPSTAGDGGFTGPLREDPDGIRQTSDGRSKIELKMKVGNRNHTAIILAPAANLVAISALSSSDVVTVYGRLTERTWEVGKPTVKEIVDVTRVTRDGQTLVDLGGVQPTLAADAPTPTPTPQAAAPAPAPAPVVPTPGPERWAVLEEEAIVDEPVVLQSWAMHNYPDQPDRPPYFRGIFLRANGELFQATAPLDDLEALHYLDIDIANVASFAFAEGDKVQLLGTFAKGTRARGWVLITGLGAL